MGREKTKRRKDRRWEEKRERIHVKYTYKLIMTKIRTDRNVILNLAKWRVSQ